VAILCCQLIGLIVVILWSTLPRDHKPKAKLEKGERKYIMHNIINADERRKKEKNHGNTLRVQNFNAPSLVPTLAPSEDEVSPTEDCKNRRPVP